MKHSFFTITLLVSLSACSLVRPGKESLPVSSHQRQQQIDSMIENGQYGSARDALVAIDAADPEYARYARQRRELEERIHQFEERTLQQSIVLINDNQWGEALATLDSALVKLPKSTALKDRLAGIHAMQKSRISELELQIAVVRARALSDSLPLHRKISEISPRDPATREALNRLQQESHELAARLGQEGQSSVRLGKTAEGSEMLRLAAKLTDDASARNQYLAHLNAIERREEENQSKARKSRKSKKRKKKKQIARFNKSLAQFDQLVAKKQFVQARDLIERLAKINPGSEAVRNRKQILEPEILKVVEQSYQQGVNYYSAEKYQMALNSWKHTLELDPGHKKAREYSERAEKILQNLDRLREKQKQARAATP